MPSVAQEPLINGLSFMLKDKHPEPAISGFTAVNVNGRASPSSLPRSKGVNGMNGDTIHVRPFEARPSEDIREPKASLPVREDRNPPPPRPQSAQNGLSNGHRSPPPPAYRAGTPESQGKRKRSSSAEEDHSYRSAQDTSRRRLDSLNSTERDETSSRPPPVTMEAPLHPHFQLAERAETEVRWPVRDQTERIHRAYSEHPPRAIEIPEPGIKTSPTSSVAPVGAIETPQSATEHSSTTEITRAGVQVDKKQRKRQFANRTKTGCATCRRRKKKCDEAKPECNNCQRGGFICEGYANKIPYPKNNVKQSHIPLQAKDRYPDPPQYYHNHGQTREGYPDPNAQHSMEGARARPIVVEEHERQADRNAWGNNWSHPPRPQYPPEQPAAPQYSHPPNNIANHERPPSNGHHVPHPHDHPSQHQPPPDRMYPHTPQPMTSQSLQNSPAVTAQLALQHSAHQPQTMHPPPLPGPPGQRHPGPVLQPPRPQKTEKQKMLNGEHYLFFHAELREERSQCKAALYRFHNSDNPSMGISREERDRLFRGVVEAQWVRQKGPDQPIGSVGKDVEVDVGFNCEYGYNIHVGDAVVIGANCTIQDCSRVNIGKLSIIGPNVNIYTNTVASDPRFRNGSRGTAIAKEVNIEDNVFIGGNATILPGVRIGKGSTIAAGAVVTQDIGPFTIAYGKKTHAQAVRGIWNDSYAH